MVTTKVPGLAQALQQPAVGVEVELPLTDDTTLSTTVSLPDAVGMLALKSFGPHGPHEDRDVEDLWRCLEIAAAEGVEPTTFNSSEPLRQVAWRCGESSTPTAPRSRR